MQKQSVNHFSVRGLINLATVVLLLTVALCYIFTNNTATVKDEIVYGLLFFMLIVVYLILMTGLITPLIKLANAVTAITKGAYDTEIPYYNNRLFIRLNQAVTNLRDNLKAAHELIQAMINFQVNTQADYFTFLQSQDNPLAKSLQALHEQDTSFAAKEAERSWTTQGMAKFVEILRSGNQTIEELSQSIISNLVKYIGAHQGGIYVVETDEAGMDLLRLTGAYAHDSELLGTTYNIGEGLVGQAFEDKSTILINELSEGQFIVRSGAGEAPPKALLIVPAIVNDSAFAVIEIASFSAFQPYQVAFVERLGESIAAAISGSIAAMRNRRLLEELSLQTEQMRAQEDLMRQNVEQAFQMQAELEKKIAEMNKMKEEEQKRMDALRATQQKMLERILEKHKEQLAQKDAEIAALKQQIEQSNTPS
ncbi:GAF domain-containing protein [Rhodoflexus caldus]|uniref:GAF domain-containing protein n=1 Tax=Rhodoflexus caldus TaxID=2891236 RepID=UPI00202A01EE|nr:GAF domain-containing protein [Rhodoflexus caldus]